MVSLRSGLSWGPVTPIPHRPLAPNTAGSVNPRGRGSLHPPHRLQNAAFLPQKRSGQGAGAGATKMLQKGHKATASPSIPRQGGVAQAHRWRVPHHLLVPMDEPTPPATHQPAGAETGRGIWWWVLGFFFNNLLLRSPQRGRRLAGTATSAHGTSCPASAGGGTRTPSKGIQQPQNGGSAEPASRQGKIKAEKMKKKKRKKKREREGSPLSQGGNAAPAGHAAGSGCGMRDLGCTPNPWGGGVSCPGLQEGNKRKSIPNKSNWAKGWGSRRWDTVPCPSGTTMPWTCLSPRGKISTSPHRNPPIFSLDWGFFLTCHGPRRG